MVDNKKAEEASEMDSVQWVNSVFEALSNERRRLILHYLSRSEGQVDVDDVVDFVIETAPDVSPEEAIEIELHHWHLPKLHDLDIIKYDPHNETARFRERSPIRIYLEHVEDRDLS